MVEDFMIVIIMGASFSCKNFMDLVSTNFTVVPAANFFATGLYAPIRCRRQCEQLVLIEDCIGDSCGSLVTVMIVSSMKAVTLGITRIGFADGSAIAEVREQILRLNLAFAKGAQVIGEGFVLVETDLAREGADKTLVEDAAGELVEVLVLDRAEHAGANLGGGRDGFEREAAQLALSAKFFSE